MSTYIFDEQTARIEEFDPPASSYLGVPLNSFPSEHSVVMLYGAKGRGIPSREIWDPSAKEDSEDEFGTSSEQEHDCVSEIKAIMFKFNHYKE